MIVAAAAAGMAWAGVSGNSVASGSLSSSAMGKKKAAASLKNNTGRTCQRILHTSAINAKVSCLQKEGGRLLNPIQVPALGGEQSSSHQHCFPRPSHKLPSLLGRTSCLPR